MRSKIYHNLKESKFYFKTENFLFFFSSAFYLEKFQSMRSEFLKNERYKLESRFNVQFDGSDYFDFILYKQVEKRGYYVVDISKNEVYKSSTDFKCVARIVKVGD